MLQQHEPQSERIAPQQSLAYDEGGKPQECVTHRLIACPECLEHAYHLRTLKYYDEQARYHGHGGHSHHYRQYYPYVQVEQVKPREYLRTDFLYGLACVCIAVLIGSAVDLINEVFLYLGKSVEVANSDLGPRYETLLPAIEPTRGVQVGIAHYVVVLRKIGLVYAADDKPPHPHTVIAYEIGEYTVATVQPQLVSHDLIIDTIQFVFFHHLLWMRIGFKGGRVRIVSV